MSPPSGRACRCHGRGPWGSTRDKEMKNRQASRAQVKVPASVRPLVERIGRIADRRGLATYVVGGCVRDWWLGQPPTTDLDLAVEGDGIALAKDVARALRSTVRVHEQFGTATVLRSARPGRRIDVASCRREVYARPAAYPRVSAGTLEDDLFRRDFTINAMAIALNPARFGTLLDPFGGVGDLARGELRVLHERSFLDDPSRILRGVRFAQRFGFAWEPKTRRLLREAVAAGALGWLNAGRLQRELNRMREEPDAVACFERLAELLNARVRQARSR